MVLSIVLVIIRMVVIMIFGMVINWMDANDNLEFTFTMGVVKMYKGIALGEIKNIEN